MSNYIHSLKVGDSVRFKHIPLNVKKQYPFTGVRTITMLAVGVGIAPMLQALHAVLTGIRALSQMVRHCLAWTRHALMRRPCIDRTYSRRGWRQHTSGISIRKPLCGRYPHAGAPRWSLFFVRASNPILTLGNFFYIHMFCSTGVRLTWSICLSFPRIPVSLPPLFPLSHPSLLLSHEGSLGRGAQGKV
jgi:hypothetical protein